MSKSTSTRMTAAETDRLHIEKLATAGLKINLRNAKTELLSMRNAMKAGQACYYQAGVFLRRAIYDLQAARICEPGNEQIKEMAGAAYQRAIPLHERSCVDKTHWSDLAALAQWQRAF